MGTIEKKECEASGKVAVLHVKGNAWRTFNLICKRDHMLRADRGDLRKIWDAMHGHWDFPNSWTVTRWESPEYLGRDENFSKSCGNKEWGRLIKVLDMSQKEWDEYNGEEESQDEDEDESLLGDSSFEA